MNRKHTFKLFAFIQVLLLTLMMIGVNPVTTVHAAAVKIMPLGDSITGSPGCWRAILWTRLQSSGFTNIDFVGTLPAPGCGISYDGNNEGHGGFLATNIANQNLLPGWLSATTPDIVMMHLGTNDVWNGIAPTTILAAFSTLVNQMRASNPNMKILVAKILPMNPSGCSACAQRVIDFNATIPGWASSKSTAQSPIVVVDQWSGFNDATDTLDGVHPNASGNQKMSDRWYPALAAFLTNSPTPTPTRTSTPRVCSPPTAELMRVSPVTSPVTTITQVITVTLGHSTSVTVTSEAGSFTSTTPVNNVFSINVNLVRGTTNHLTVLGQVTYASNCPPYSLSTGVDTNGNPLTIVQNPGTITATPTRTPTPTPTGTVTVPACSPVSASITAPFTKDGTGAFCWQSSNLGSYVNSWNLANLAINGVNFTNLYVPASTYPAKINGFWYVSYTGNFAWSHFETK